MSPAGDPPGEPPSLLKGSASSHGNSSVPERTRHSTTTLELAERLERLGFRRLARRLYDCASNFLGWRCGSSLCPRCGRRRANRRRILVQRWLGHSSNQFGLLTLTLPSASLAEGRDAISAAMRRLRRHPAWMAAVGAGRGRIEFEACVTGDRNWNLHAHLAIQLHKDKRFPVQALAAAWKKITSDGRLHWDVRRQTSKKAVAFYVTKIKRSELLDLSDEQLREVATAVPYRRWALHFGDRRNRRG